MIWVAQSALPSRRLKTHQRWVTARAPCPRRLAAGSGHAALEQTWIIDGSLVDLDGAASAGQFVWRPGGNVHQAYSPNGAVLLGMFMKPNIFANGTEFYVE